MAEPVAAGPALTFGPFTLDRSQRLLSRGGQLVSLEPKVIETLVVLVEAQGQLVPKEKLLRRVWPDTFVEEGSLARNISTLRKTLGDADDNTKYIETIPKRGYRFVAPVRTADPAPLAERARQRIPPVLIVVG